MDEVLNASRRSSMRSFLTSPCRLRTCKRLQQGIKFWCLRSLILC